MVNTFWLNNRGFLPRFEFWNSVLFWQLWGFCCCFLLLDNFSHFSCIAPCKNGCRLSITYLQTNFFKYFIVEFLIPHLNVNYGVVVNQFVIDAPDYWLLAAFIHQVTHVKLVSVNCLVFELFHSLLELLFIMFEVFNAVSQGVTSFNFDFQLFLGRG